MEPPYKKILVIRLGSLGDILLATPVLRAIKRRNQESEVHFLLKSAYADLLVCNENVDEIIRLDSSTGLGGLMGLARRLRGRYDLLVDLHRSLRSFVLRSFIGATRTLKYPKGVLRRTLMIQTGWKAASLKNPIPERYLMALEPMGIEPDGEGLDLVIPDTIRSEVDSILERETGPSTSTCPIMVPHSAKEGPGSYFSIAPGARWATKRWLPERFARVADILAERYRLVPILIGDHQDQPLSLSIVRGMNSPAIDMSGKLGLLETGSVIERSRLLVCNDSGLMHMAAALSTPIVAVFGPTTRELGFYPYHATSEVVSSDIPCRPCHHIGSDKCPLGHHMCMQEVTVEEVVEAASRLMEPAGDMVPGGRVSNACR
jgi:heptosyltransferase-2